MAGLGTYTGTFTLSDLKRRAGAWLEFGEIEDAFSITVNGKQLPNLDPISTRVDIGAYLRRGRNVVTVDVASTLYNAASKPLKDYGLLGTSGTVTVRPYEERLVARTARAGRLAAAK